MRILHPIDLLFPSHPHQGPPCPRASPHNGPLAHAQIPTDLTLPDPSLRTVYRQDTGAHHHADICHQFTH